MRRFLMMSAAGHGAVVVLMFITAALLSRPKTGVYSIDLLSSLPSGTSGGAAPVEEPQPAPKTPTPPIPAPKPTPVKTPPKEALKIPEKQKKPPVKAKTVTKPVTPAKPKSTPKPSHATEQPPAATDNGSEGVGLGQGGMNGAGIVGTAGATFPYPWYLKAIADKLDAQWHPENFQPDTRCVIDFVIHTDGTVSNSKVAKASGDSVFDEMAMRAVLYASPLPPLPNGYPENQLTVHFTFAGKGE